MKLASEWRAAVAATTMCIAMTGCAAPDPHGAEPGGRFDLLSFRDGDAVSSRTLFRGELGYGERNTGAFEPGQIFGYEFAGNAGDVVTISVRSSAEGTDPILFVYEPRHPDETCEHQDPVAYDDDIDWPNDFDARVGDLRLERDGMYLIAFADKALSSGDYTVSLSCASGDCAPELVCGGLSARGCPPGYTCTRATACESYSGTCERGCMDEDGDGYGPGCGEPDCDDARPECTTDCSDGDGNGIPDCAERPLGDQIVAGPSSTLAVHPDTGELIKWGLHPYIGFPTGGEFILESPVPARVPLRESGRPTDLANDTQVSCAVIDAKVFCWGQGAGQVGAGGIRHDSNRWFEATPRGAQAGRVRAVRITEAPLGFHDYEVLELDGVAEVTLGDEHGCARQHAGRVLCWGDDSLGQRGATLPGANYRDHYEYGERSRTYAWGYAAPIRGIDDAVQVDAGTDHTCVLHGDGTISCWGDNRYGQLGDGTDFNVAVAPLAVRGIDDAVHVSAGNDSTCAVHEDGRVSCWGRVHSHIEFGRIRAHRTPLEVLGLAEPIRRVSVGRGSHTCALGDSGAVYCWGEGILGTGVEEVQTSEFPLRVLGVESAVEVSVGHGHTCVRLQSGTLSCWGANGRGQVGDGSSGYMSPRYQPVPVRDAL